MTSKMSSVQLDKVSAAPALKLPQLFTLTPNSSGKAGNLQKRQTLAAQNNQVENASEKKLPNQIFPKNHSDHQARGSSFSLPCL